MRFGFHFYFKIVTIFSRSSFSDFCQRYSRDERYKGIEKLRDRESIFNEYLVELRKKEKNEKQHKKEQVSSIS